MKRDMSTIRNDVDSVHQCKEDIEDLRNSIDKLQEQNRRRKLRLLEQVQLTTDIRVTALHAPSLPLLFVSNFVISVIYSLILFFYLFI